MEVLLWARRWHLLIQLANCSEKQVTFFHVAILTCLDHAKVWGDKALNFLQLSTAFEEGAQAAQSWRCQARPAGGLDLSWGEGGRLDWGPYPDCREGHASPHHPEETTGTTGRSRKTPPSHMKLEIHLKILDPWISQLIYFILKEKKVLVQWLPVTWETC